MKRVTLYVLLVFVATIVSAQRRTVTGAIADDSGAPILGVTVLEQGTTNGTTSNLDGSFSLSVQDGATLEFSYIGYQNQTAIVKSDTPLRITLKEETQQLDDIVVVGYGTVKKSSLTASVASVKGKDLERSQGTDVSAALQGKIAGVEILDGGAVPGGSFKMVIRGTGTVSKSGSTEPLIIIDNAFANETGLKAINPADIASMEILKDGSAAAIYGSRAANGVIIVTTKQGKKGAPVVNVDFSYSMQNPTKTLDYLNADEWRYFSKLLVANSQLPGSPAKLTNASENINPTNPNLNTDWQKLWFRSNTPVYNANASISGGGEHFTYNTSLGYYNQEGIIYGTMYNKFTGRLNMTYKKGILTISENLAVGRRKQDPLSTPRPSIGLPTVPVKDAQGRFISGGPEYYISGGKVTNPLASIYYQDSYKTNVDVIGGINIGLNFFKGFTYKLGISGTYTSIHEFSHNPTWYTMWYDNGEPDKEYGNDRNDLSEKRGEKYNYTIDNIINYNYACGKHDLDVMLGTSWLKEHTRTLAANNVEDMGGSNIIGSSGGKIDGKFQALQYEAAMLSFFGRINYGYDNRYLVSASLRRDESSKYPKKTRAGYFPSASAAWNLHNESFFPKQDVVSSVKFRGSWGQLGASFLDPYSFSSLAYGPVSYIFGGEIRGNDGTVIYGANNNLKWEVCTTWDIGLDMSLFNNKVHLTVDYYNKKNKDLLVQLNNIPSAGTQLTINKGDAVPWSNNASVVNRGWEFTLGYRNQFSNGLYVDVTGNLSTFSNEVLSLGYNAPPILGDAFYGGSAERTTKTMVGYPIGSFWGYVVDHVDPNTGYFVFKDLDNSGTITVDDKTVIGNPFPNFTYGVSLSMAYKGFDFALDLQGVQGNDILSSQKYNRLFSYGSNVVTDVFKGWTPSTPNTNYPIMQSGRAENGYISTFFVEDGSYLRGKNVTLGYSFNQPWVKRLGISKLRVYASLQNFFTISKFSGYDPEVGYGEGIVERGVDKNALPNIMTTSFGINLTF